MVSLKQINISIATLIICLGHAINSYSILIEMHLNKKIIPTYVGYRLITNNSYTPEIPVSTNYHLSNEEVKLTTDLPCNYLLREKLSTVVINLKYMKSGSIKKHSVDIILNGKDEILSTNKKIVISIPDNPILFEINNLSYEKMDSFSLYEIIEFTSIATLIGCCSLWCT